MPSADRYLAALEGPTETSGSFVGSPRSPAINEQSDDLLSKIKLIGPLNGAHARTPLDAVASKPHPPHFLVPDRVATYVKFLEAQPARYGPAFAIFDPKHDWNSSDFPLNLCEFLAYKTALAYYGDTRIRENLLNEHPAGISDYAFFNSRNTNGDTQAFAFVLDGAAYVIFRGTEFFTLADWATDFDTKLTTGLPQDRYSTEQDLIGPREPGRHTGFAIAWGHVRAEIETWAKSVFQHRKAARLIFSGHSLGGALAIIAAHHFEKSPNLPYEIGAVVAFGAPMVGGKDFQVEYDETLKLKQRTIRVSATLDLVTLLTLAPMTYRHVGREWHLKRRPAFSRWRMYFFTPLWNPKDEADKKSGAKQPRQETNRAAFGTRSWLAGLALKVLWFLVRLLRRAQAAHSVNSNYALYLTVLSYQALRKAPRITYDEAYARLRDHLAYVRGRNGNLFGVAKKGPIKVKSQSDEEWLAKQFEHFIV